MYANKAVVGALLAALSVLVAEGKDTLPAWLLVVLAAVVAGLAVYAVPNRDLSWLKHPGGSSGARRRQSGQSAGFVVLVVLAVVGALYVIVDVSRGNLC